MLKKFLKEYSMDDKVFIKFLSDEKVNSIKELFDIFEKIPEEYIFEKSVLKELKETNLFHFVNGFPIKDIEYHSKDLSSIFKSFKNLEQIIEKNKLGNVLKEYNEPVLQKELQKYISKSKDYLLEIIVNLDDYLNDTLTVLSDESIKNKRVVISGVLSKEREYYIKQISDNGGSYTNTISTNVDYLVVGSLNHKTKKVLDAEKKGIKVIDEDEFEAILANK